MKRSTVGLLIAVLAAQALAFGYVRVVTSNGAPLVRTDASSIQYVVHSSMRPGAVNAEGAVVITPLSDPMGALSAAASTWTAVASATVRFAPLKSTASPRAAGDNVYTMTIEDTPQNRSAVGSALAVTLLFFNPANGQVSDADILFNTNIVENGSVVPFSTDRATPSYDLQTVAVHELGHALGAAHSGVIAATMYPYTGRFAQGFTAEEATNSSTLSADDVAFVTTVYPAPDAAAQFGKITGTVTRGGSGVVGALVTAADADQGIVVGGLVTSASGAFAIAMLRPGNYQVFAHPLDGPVTPGNFNSNQFGGLAPVTSFQMTFSGGNSAPASIAVPAGGSAEANIVIPDAASGMHIDFLGTGGVAGNDFGLGGVRSLTGGNSRMLYLWGKGLDASLTESNIRILGPAAKLRAGTLGTDPKFLVNGLVPIRFVVDVAGTGVRTPIPLAVVKAGDATVDDGTLVLLPDGGPPSASNLGVVNAANFEGGAVAPGEVVTVFGKQFGPSGSTVVLAALDPSGKLATLRSDTRVLFDGRPSPIVYVVNNAVSAVVPWEVAGQKSTSMTVEYNGVASAPVNLAVAASGPAFFTACSCGSGQVAAFNPDNSYNSAANPAPIGGTLVMFWTGGGTLNPAAGTGDIIPGLVNPSVTPTVTIGGIQAPLVYWGAAPTFVAGLMQLNVSIPAGVEPGPAVPIVITSGDYSSRPGVTLAVK